MKRPAAVRVGKSKKDEEGYSPAELRQQRDALWRHFAGIVGQKGSMDRKTGMSRAERKAESERDKTADGEETKEGAEEEQFGEFDNEDRFHSLSEHPKQPQQEEATVDLETLEAESDITNVGPTFDDSERRVAFALLGEQRRRDDLAEGDTLEEGQEWTIDLEHEMDAPITLVRGGVGGFGNSFFASTDNRAPTLATRGSPGQEATVHLEWKFKGDVGLIGLPNAGKSTFLKAVCATGDDVRVAGYAFTTINPNVGVVRLGERGLLGVSSTEPIEESRARLLVAQHSKNDDGKGELAGVQAAATASANFGNEESTRFILQDLPGLVRGASYNRGLGHDFLKHIERCLALYYVLDVSEAAKTPWMDLQLVHDELEAYRTGLSSKVQGIIANKCDAIHIDEQQQQHEHAEPVLAVTGEAEETAIDGRQKLRMLAEEAKALHGRTIPVWNVSAKYRNGVERTARAMARVVAREKQERNRKEEKVDTEYPL